MLNPDEAANIAGVSRTKMKTLLSSGEIPSAKVGKRRLIMQESILEWARKQVRG